MTKELYNEICTLLDGKGFKTEIIYDDTNHLGEDQYKIRLTDNDGRITIRAVESKIPAMLGRLFGEQNGN